MVKIIFKKGTSIEVQRHIIDYWRGMEDGFRKGFYSFLPHLDYLKATNRIDDQEYNSSIANKDKISVISTIHKKCSIARREDGDQTLYTKIWPEIKEEYDRK